ncbi:MAG: HAMP domain-containing histidine kinase [Candidatus Pacebacteria bacterium]|nr:HAMP domain-containing histidine kinase [Candidatus Paceibacterota bacterium]
MTQVNESVTSVFPKGIQLRTKIFLALALCSTLPLTLTLLFDAVLLKDAESRALFIEFMSSNVPVYGYELHFYLIFVILIFGVSLAAAAAYMDWAFVHPIHKITKWIEETRSTAFEKVPVMPEPHSQDIADLERAVAASLTYSASTRSQNASLAGKKDELVVIAAHQLRTPLTGLKWAVSTLSDPALSEADRKTRVTEIQDTIVRIGLIVDNIVASADIEEGKFGYTFSDVDVIDVIKKQLGNLALPIKERALTIVTTFPKGECVSFMDAYRMSTAMYNLLENAVEYTPQKGKIQITLVDSGTGYELTIEDSGIGISDNDKRNLFTKFFRGDSAKHMRPNGSGLGLYLAKHVAESHGGKIWLESFEGKGTKVTLPLPYSQAKQPPAAGLTKTA